MIAWFSQDAPIRVKFRVLTLLYLLLSGGIAALAIGTALGRLHKRGLNLRQARLRKGASNPDGSRHGP